LILPETVKALEKRLLAEALARNQDDTALTAAQLGIARRTLQQKIKTYQV
jgi:transcriptional regulator with PAS, ATPase and Fis domain